MSDKDPSIKPWGGRFSEPTDQFVERFTASVSFDQRLYHHDINGSLAHAAMLEKVGVLTAQELADIQQGLEEIRAEILAGTFEWSVSLEDVHMNIEARLTDKIGITGKKLHTGRSRNDQVATDIRLYVRDELALICKELSRLQLGLITLAKLEANTIMPGFTHLQTAQPVTFGHHMLAWNEMLERDYSRFQDCAARLNQCPLGAAALAGTTYPIDRHYSAELLGFDRPTENSLDSVSDRDFAIEFAAAASVLMTHMSRFSEELVLMKSQPLAYNKDNQEDKEPIFDIIDTVKDCLKAYADMVPAITVNEDVTREAAMRGFSTATDLADYLVRKGLPFRDAHEVVGKSVAYGIAEKKDLSEMSLDELRTFSTDIEADVFDVLTLEGSVNARNHIGGTAPQQVLAAAERAELRLNQRA
mgnify:CR=1 FL=1